MPLTSEVKGEIISKYRQGAQDTGSPEVQVALLTARINELTPHFKVHLKDHHVARTKSGINVGNPDHRAKQQPGRRHQDQRQRELRGDERARDPLPAFIRSGPSFARHAGPQQRRRSRRKPPRPRRSPGVRAVTRAIEAKSPRKLPGRALPGPEGEVSGRRFFIESRERRREEAPVPALTLTALCCATRELAMSGLPIILTQGQLVLDKDLTITGLGLGLTTISGGGAIAVIGTQVDVFRSTLSGNSAAGPGSEGGGGLFQANGAVSRAGRCCGDAGSARAPASARP